MALGVRRRHRLLHRRRTSKAVCATRNFFLPLLILCNLALPVGAAAAAADDLDQVTVTGKKLRELEREVVEAEDHFYRRFNTLNSDDDFDINCRKEKATGTLIPQRQCRIKFLVDAGATDAQEFLKGLTTAAAAPGVNTPVAALQMQWTQRHEEYRQAVKTLLEKDPELLSLGSEWVRLQAQYDRVRKENQKDKPIH